MAKFDMFNGNRGRTKSEDKQFNTWYDDLIWCPSQCYYYFMHDGEMFCIYLRWRHQDPWTAEIIKCANGDFDLHPDTSTWKFIKIPYFEDYELEKLKEFIMARLDIILTLWPHCEQNISLRIEEYKTLPVEIRQQVWQKTQALLDGCRPPIRRIKTHHVGEIKGFDMLLQMEVRDYIARHKDEIGVGDGIYINPETSDITITNIKEVSDLSNFYPFTSLVKFDPKVDTYYVDKNATGDVAFTYYEYTI